MNQVNHTTNQKPKVEERDHINQTPVEKLKEDPGQKELEVIKQKKPHKKQKIVRDPQQIKELRLERLNVKREVCWDARFIKDTIPDFFAQKPRGRKVDKMSKGRTPLESVYVEKEKSRLPDIQAEKMRDTISTHKRKSFKIRPIKKEGQRNKEQTIVPEKPLITQQQNGKQVKKTRKLKSKERLLDKLEQKLKTFPMNNKYKQLLVDVIQRSTQKKYRSIRTSVQKQIDSIGTENHVYKRLEKMVETRRTMLRQIQEKEEQTNLKTCIDFQMHSLQLIEEILKFKAFWESIYSDTLRYPTKVHFYYQNSNYLAEINQQMGERAKKDPFLIEITSKLLKNSNHASTEEEIRQRKEMMLKIRACELLLIEEELLATQ